MLQHPGPCPPCLDRVGEARRDFNGVGRIALWLGNPKICERGVIGVTQKQATEKLGLTLRAMQHYEGGTRVIPRVIELACWALENRTASY
jgi:hypothetical protein